MSSPFTRSRMGSTPVDGGMVFGSIEVQPAKPPASATTNMLSGAMSRIRTGLFGSAYPKQTSSNQVVTKFTGDKFQSPDNSLYHYHEGDVFTPGTGNYVFESPFELPIQTLWGYGFLYRPNFMKSIQQPQVYANPQIQLNGLGGMQAGQFALTPLDTLGT